MGSLVYVASFFGTITRLVLRSREVSSADSHGAIQGSSARALIGDRLLSVPFCARIFRFRSFHLFNNVNERRHFDVVNEVRIRPPTSRLRVDFPDNASIPLALRVIGMSGGDFSIRTNLEKLGIAERLPHRRANPRARHYTEYYTPKTRDVIVNKFRVVPLWSQTVNQHFTLSERHISSDG